MAIKFVPRFAVDDQQLSMLHARAFAGNTTDVRPWSQRLEKHALTWVGAFDAEQLVGFIQVIWDGGAHAFLLDTAVDPDRRHHGIGANLVNLPVQRGIGLIEGDEGKVRLTCKDLSV